ncbi:response regulator [Nocardioides sp. zg-1308]|uniref:Response regulator n=1 Tax=Nocardioides renjunii TaxID=3095075 RepID=A0ABU5KEA7_9ACTN|nr:MULTISPECIES: response regulator [unclassified Nocardioides]MDZ5663299.1 response regulator [Nocardioides sp. S-58]NPD04935.1 response regulator [Nocardioides sp. zg-1308]WQQ22827.1 response regulator [Nocardioides sp. S-34]
MDRVLVVDDDDDIRDLIVFALRRRGFEVHSSGDPLAALAFATAEGCTAAVLDWSMPTMDGGELCARLRELPDLRSVPIVILTAHADAETREKAFAAGATRYVTKPFSLKHLAEVVAELVAAPEG